MTGNNDAYFDKDFIGFTVYIRDPGGVILRPHYFGRKGGHCLAYGVVGHMPPPDSFGWFTIEGDYQYWEP